MVFNTTINHIILHAEDLPVFLSASSSTTVVQFSFLTSSGFSGVPTTDLESYHSDDPCLSEQRRPRPYQQFVTMVHTVSAFAGRSQAHFTYSHKTQSEGAYAIWQTLDAPEPCLATTAPSQLQ